ncbi:hypothetical protein EG329_001019 [Mollisiaceae sp. DMI_Dod_QoI]|nr:hypothetical protein EG329_001019 [Helotiales sp. DMI_Dod_QoI]
MSPRNDIYLSLCLAQAELSPLHYRHGAIIVRGGKVIGQGFNCYTPGFDGGALKSGTLPSNSTDGPAIAELKERLKSKPKLKSKSKLDNQQDSGMFTPFESMGCGHNANTPLSMHSEMMAIKSALSLSSGTLSSQMSARSAKYFEKPCFKLPSDSKKRKSRAHALKASLFKSRALKRVHLNQVNKESNYNPKDKEDSGFQEGKENVAEHTNESAEKHLKKNRYEYQYAHQYRTGYYPHGPLHKHYQHKRGSEPHSSKTFDNSAPLDTQPSSSSEDSIRSKNRKIKPPKKPRPSPPGPRQILITKNKSLNTKHSVSCRTKDPRLKGSDLYVARLGTHHTTPPIKPKSQYHQPEPPSLPPSPKSEPSSLYDELSHSSRSTSPSTASEKTAPPLMPQIRESRPCYRCVAAMHSAGIKRVFWTTQDGEWEGAKVSDLVEALEMGLEADGENGPGTGQESKGVFVTKHEVLMLKRMMGL